MWSTEKRCKVGQNLTIVCHSDAIDLVYESPSGEQTVVFRALRHHPKPLEDLQRGLSEARRDWFDEWTGAREEKRG
jgi:hypothetical protein